MFRSKSILIVDDEEGLLALLKHALEERGFEVSTANNAIDAGVAISSELPALILMDVKMPGIDGFQACVALKNNPKTKDTPVIIISAISDDSEIGRAKKMGVADYFTKPLDIEKLINRIKEII